MTAGCTIPLLSIKFGRSATRSVSSTTTLSSDPLWAFAARADERLPLAPTVENSNAPMIAVAAGYARIPRMDLLLENSDPRPRAWTGTDELVLRAAAAQR